MNQTPRSRIDLLPHYSRLIATLTRYMPDVGSEVVALVGPSFHQLNEPSEVVVVVGAGLQISTT